MYIADREKQELERGAAIPDGSLRGACKHLIAASAQPLNVSCEKLHFVHLSWHGTSHVPLTQEVAAATAAGTKQTMSALMLHALSSMLLTLPRLGRCDVDTSCVDCHSDGLFNRLTLSSSVTCCLMLHQWLVAKLANLNQKHTAQGGMHSNQSE